MDVAPLALNHSKGSWVVGGATIVSSRVSSVLSWAGLLYTAICYIAGHLPEIEDSSGARQSVDGGDRSVDDDSEQLEPILEQLTTHVPDLIVFRSHDAPIPQTIHSYGVIMFGDISGKFLNLQ